MTREGFEERWKGELAQVEVAFLRHGEVPPMFVVVGRDGRDHPVMANLADPDGRELTYAIVRLATLAMDAPIVLYRGEAWAAAGDVLPEHGSPPAVERRVEVVIVAAAARLEGLDRIEYRTSVREIEHGHDERPVGLRDFALPPGAGADDPEPDGTADGYAGPLANVLPRQRPTPAERRKARDTLERAVKRAGRGKPPFAR